MKNHNSQPRWIEWAREIQSLSQTGLTFTHDEYETQRYNRLIEISAEIMQQYTEIPNEKFIDDFQFQKGYATPKVDVRGACIRDNKILLVQERIDQRWCMPGGWADVGDIPSEMVVREVLEESGFLVTAQKIIGIYDANRQGRPLEFYHAYKIIFLCKITGGEAKVSNETMGVDFFDMQDLPPLSSNRTNERHLKDVFSHYENPDTLTFFD